MLCAVRIQILQEADKLEKQPRCKLICSSAALLEIIQPFPPQRADVLYLQSLLCVMVLKFKIFTLVAGAIDIFRFFQLLCCYNIG